MTQHRFIYTVDALHDQSETRFFFSISEAFLETFLFPEKTIFFSNK